jgi:hypothetical protein
MHASSLNTFRASHASTRNELFYTERDQMVVTTNADGFRAIEDLGREAIVKLPAFT